jgi:hypothetical protein
VAVSEVGAAARTVHHRVLLRLDAHDGTAALKRNPSGRSRFGQDRSRLLAGLRVERVFASNAQGSRLRERPVARRMFDGAGRRNQLLSRASPQWVRSGRARLRERGRQSSQTRSLRDAGESPDVRVGLATAARNSTAQAVGRLAYLVSLGDTVADRGRSRLSPHTLHLAAASCTDESPDLQRVQFGAVRCS